MAVQCDNCGNRITGNSERLYVGMFRQKYGLSTFDPFGVNSRSVLSYEPVGETKPVDICASCVETVKGRLALFLTSGWQEER